MKIEITLGQIGLMWFTLGLFAYLLGDFLFTEKETRIKEPVWTRFYEEETFWICLARGPFAFKLVYDVWRETKE